MTFLDRSSPAATAGLEPAAEGIETGTGELVGIGLQREALERNYWHMRQRREDTRQYTILDDMSEQIYGDRKSWRGEQLPKTAFPNPMTQNAGETATSAFVVDADKKIDKMFKDLTALRSVDPGTFANFPGSVADMDSVVQEQVRKEMSEELAELDQRAANRSSPSVAGAAAEFTGMAGAAVSDIEGLVTLPFGAGSGSLGRTMLIEGLLGAGSEALAIPAYNAQAAFVGRDAPDPVQLLLFGATFGAALPLAGRGVKEGAGLAVRGGRITNRALLAGARRITRSDKVRGASTALARDQATLDGAPAGVPPDIHADDVDRAEVQLQDGSPVVVRPDPVDGPDPANWPSIQAGIFAGESGGDYDALFGFSNRQGGPFANVRVTEMSIDQAIQFSSPRGTYGQWVKGRIGRVATPMGAYQVVGTTLRHAKRGLGLTGAEKFDVAMQDRIGKWILRQQGTDAWEGYRGPRTPGSGRSAGPARFVGSDGNGAAFEARFDGAQIRADETGIKLEVGDVSFARPWSQEEGPQPWAQPGDPGPGPRPTPADIIPQIQRALQEAREADYPAQRPLIDFLQNGHRGRAGQPGNARPSLQLDPDGPAAQELSALGVTRQQFPRLFRNGGVRELDTLNAAEFEADFPGIIDATGSRDEALNGYLNPQGVVDVMAQEAAGDATWLQTRARVAELEEELTFWDAAAQRADASTDVDLDPGDVPVSIPDDVLAPAAAGEQLTLEAAGNQPTIGTDHRDPALFSDPADSPGVVSQIDQLERDLRAMFDPNADNDIDVPLGGEDAGMTTARAVLNDIDEEADFLEQLKICMPKGVANG
ncbi:MAG: hypothetical protein AAFP87_20515 [Pseudomonadota bacterium]